MKQKKKKSKDKSRQRKRKRSHQQQQQQQISTKQSDKIELQQQQQTDRKAQKRQRQQKQKTKNSKSDTNTTIKDNKKKKKKNNKTSPPSIIHLQGQQLSVQDFRQLVNNVSKRYEGQATNLVLDEKYWQKQKQRQQLKQLRELNKKIKQQLIETNKLQRELLQQQQKDNENEQRKIDLQQQQQNYSDKRDIINNVNVNDNNNESKVKIQPQSSSHQQLQQQQLIVNKTKKQHQQSQYLDQLFLQTQQQQQKDNLDLQQDVNNPEEQLLRKGLKPKHKTKHYLLTLIHQHHKPFSKLTITDLQGTFWQLKLNLQFFIQLRSSINVACNLKTFIQYVVKSLQANSQLKQIDRVNQQTIQNLIVLEITLSIGQGLKMNCTVEVPRLLSLHQMLMSKKEKQKLIDKKEKRRQYDKLMRKFVLGMYQCKEKQLQNQRKAWEKLQNLVTQKIGHHNKQAKLSNKQNLSTTTTASKSEKKGTIQFTCNKKSTSEIPQNQPALMQPDKIRQMITNTIMLSLENPIYTTGPTQNNFNAYNNIPGGFNNNDQDYDKTKQINKKYKTDLMNPNRIRRKKQKGVRLFQ